MTPMRMSSGPSFGRGTSAMPRTDSSPNPLRTTARIWRVSMSAAMTSGNGNDLAILCRDLRKYYPDVKAVDGLDLSVPRGECFGLLGPNGAGKTTTIEILEGLTPADSGDVKILGMSWNDHDRDLRERLGISLQATKLNEKLTVYETLRLFRSLYRNGQM